ncbi:MAG: hypothetical protein VYA34_15240 [Myxococcota bacterium]|nr:hypothetical protein [Myxococcota bacterium]
MADVLEPKPNKKLPVPEPVPPKSVTIHKDTSKPHGPTAGPRDPQFLRNGFRLNLRPNESWQNAVARFFRVNTISEPILKRIAEANGFSLSEPPPPAITLPTVETLYYEVHPQNIGRKLPLLERSTFLVVEPNQNLEDIIRKTYRNYDEDTIKTLISVTAYTNKLKPSQKNLDVIYIPHTKHWKPIIAQQKHRAALNVKRAKAHPRFQQHGPGKNYHPKQLSRNVVRQILADRALKDTPTLGNLYQPEPGDDLLEIADELYGSLIENADVDEKEKKALKENILIFLARVNRLDTTDLDERRELLFLPTEKQILLAIDSTQGQEAARKFKSHQNPVWREIQEATQHNQASRVRLAKPKAPAQRQNDLTKQLEQLTRLEEKVDDVATKVEIGRQDQEATGELTTPEHNRPPVDNTHITQEIPTPPSQTPTVEPDTVFVEPGQLVIQEPGESTDAYALKLNNGILSSSELLFFRKAPELLLPVHLGLVNRNGEFEPGQKQLVENALKRVELIDAQGNVHIPGKTAEMIERFIIARIQKEAELPIWPREDESLNNFIARTQREGLGGEQEELIRALLYYSCASKRWLQQVEAGDRKSQIGPVTLLALQDSMSPGNGKTMEEFYGTPEENLVLFAILFEIPLGQTEEAKSQSTTDRKVNLTEYVLQDIFDRLHALVPGILDNEEFVEQMKRAFYQTLRIEENRSQKVKEQVNVLHRSHRLVASLIAEAEELGELIDLPSSMYQN